MCKKGLSSQKIRFWGFSGEGTCKEFFISTMTSHNVQILFVYIVCVYDKWPLLFYNYTNQTWKSLPFTKLAYVEVNNLDERSIFKITDVLRTQMTGSKHN